MTEPGAGSDLQGIRTKGDEGRRPLRASTAAKTFITNGFLAGLVLVVVQDRPGRRARKGTSILIVETEGCEGFRVGRCSTRWA